MLLQELEALRAEVARLKKAEGDAGNSDTCLYESLFNLSPDLMALVDERGTFLKTNPAMRKSLGFSGAEVDGKTFHDVMSRDVAGKRLGYGLQALRENRAVTVETSRFDTRAGCERYFKDIYTPYDRPGSPKTFVVFSREITEQKNAEERFRQQRRRYRELFERSRDGFVVVDISGRFLDANQSYCDMLGYSCDELKEMRHFFDITPASWHAWEHEEIWRKRLLTYGYSGIYEKEYIRKNGTVFPVEMQAFTVVNDSGAVEYLWGVARDISGRKRDAQVLRERETRLQRIYDHAGDAFLIFDMDGRVVDINAKAAEMYGYSRDEFIGLSGRDIVHPDYHHLFASFKREVCDGRQFHCESVDVRKDGTCFDIEVTGTDFEYRGRRHLLAIVRDISDRKKAQHALQLSEERYRSVVQNAMDAIFIADRRGTILSWNIGAQRIYGYEPDEIIGRWFFCLLPEEDRAKQERLLQKAVSAGTAPGGGKPLEGTAVCKAGKRFPIEAAFNIFTLRDEVFLTVIVRDATARKRAEEQLVHLGAAIEQATDAIQIEGSDGTVRYVNAAHERLFGRERAQLVGRSRSDSTDNEKRERIYRQVKDNVSRGRVWSGRVGFTKPDGGRVELDIRATPITDSAGTPAGFVTVYRDITDTARMEEQLRESQKMEAIGTLAGGIAHEFNNILSGIMGYAEVAKDAAAEGERPEEFLDVIIRYCDRAAELTGQILTFSHKSIQDFQPVTLQPVVKEAVKLLRATIPATIDIQQSVDERCGPVIANPTQMHQVLINLCTNAAHAIEQNIGVLSVELSPFTVGEPDAGLYPGLRPGEHVRLTVRDTGCGIEPDILDKVCEPFFTTREAGKGTGMGLAVVKGIVKTHSGVLRIESTPGMGTACSVVLPVVDTAAQARDDQAGDLPAGREHILFVDDELQLVEMAPEFFSSLGYTVTAVQTPAEALERFRRNPHTYDLVITDYTMPNMTGLMLAAELKNIRSDVPVILCSGYNDVESDNASQPGLTRAFVMKPLKRDVMAHTIREVLDTQVAEKGNLPV